MMTYPLRFLGPGQITDQQGQTVPMRSRKQLALLVYLATEHTVAHSRESLLALFWPEETAASAQNNLRVTLSRLRKLAEKITGVEQVAAALLVTDRNTVQLHPAWVERTDVNCFQRLLASTQQHEHLQRSQCAACQGALQAAAALYQGDFLAGLGLADCPAFEEWLLLQRERLRLLALDAFADLAGYAEAQDDLRAAFTFAHRQVELDPLRESAYRQQMRSLARQGERSAALAIFERCRTRLHSELGLDPEPDTLALHQQLLTAAEDGVAPAQPEPPKALTAHGQIALTPRHNLPVQLTPFIGREGEIGQLQERLADPAYRLLSIVGPGGIGKSRLAQQVATHYLTHFADGVYFVRLAQVPAVESIPAAIAEALGLSFVASQKNPAEQLIEMISNKQLLLVLDNFEHLMGGVDLLVELLRRAPRVVLVVTSREGLNLQAEDRFELQGLAIPSSSDASARDDAAVRLFVDRAHRLDKQFKLSAEQLPHVVRICQMVEGFPLALELAATWVRDLTCQEIVSELTDGLDLLETTLRDLDPQHRSLRAVFNSSWRLLTAAERRTLARLAVFRGGFNLDAARAIADAAPLLVSGLRNKSLLRNAGSRRYDMHALVQQFSAEALRSDLADEERIRLAHSHYFLTLLAEQAIALDTRAARTAADIIQPDWENVAIAWRYAIERSELALLQNALDGLVRFCNLRGLFQEAQTLLECSVAYLAGLPPGADSAQRLHLRCRLLTAQADFAGRRGLEQTRGLAQAALGLAEQIDSRTELISNYITLATACELVADFAQGGALAEKALQLAEADGLELQVGLCLDILGRIAYASGKYEQANLLFQQVLAIHEKTGRIEQRGRAATGRLGSVAIEQGRYDVALHYSKLYLESCEAVDDRRNLAHALHHWAYLWLRLGEFETAIRFEEQGIARASLLGDRELGSFALQVKAWAHRQLGQWDAALRCANEAVALARALDAQLALAYGLSQLAETQMALAQNAADWATAAATFCETAVLLRTIGKTMMAYEAEIGLAELRRRCGQIEAALQLIQPILPHLPSCMAEGWDEPIRAYVVCTQILRTVNDPAAETLLAQGLQLLECLAQKITDRTLRQNFLDAIPAHRELYHLRL